jgi:hypothetical protein
MLYIYYCIYFIVGDLLEVTKKIKRGREVKEDTLTISTFFMRKGNYDTLT